MNDNFRKQLSSFAIALQFMTRLPGLNNAEWSKERERASVGYYPASGAVIGLIAAIVYWLAAQIFSGTLASLLAVAAAVLVTGGLHEDGLADVCDGVGGGQNREKALAIMKDSHIGAYGTLGLILVIAAKVFALASLTPAIAVVALVGAHVTSRAAILGVLATARYARPEGGTASAVAAKPSRESWLAAGITLLLIVAGSLAVLPAGAIVCAIAGSAVAAIVVRYRFMQKLDGYTGDCLGAVQQAGELGFYLGLAAWV